MIQGNPGQIGLIDSVNKSVIVVCGNDTGIILESIEKEGKDGTRIGVVCNPL